MIEIYTDGACDYRLAVGYGGWSAIILYRDSLGKIARTEEISGFIPPPCTNNIAELTAVLEAFKHIGKERGHVTVITDSKYVKEGMVDWLPNLWMKNGWKSSTGQPVKNQPLWKQIHAASCLYHIQWRWVKGHAKNKFNMRADALAVAAKHAGMIEAGVR